MNYAEYLRGLNLEKKKKPGMKLTDRLKNDEEVYKAQKDAERLLIEKIRKGL